MKKTNLFSIICIVLFTAIFSLQAQECTEGKYVLTQNDEFFPPAKNAAAFINFDGQGFIIEGKRTFLTSGAIHYPRVPRENWRDILLKLKRSGFNTVETYIFWNYHESVEGVYDFSSENRDFVAFLDLAKELGLYAIVRVGPYVCAEWENGGYPQWLAFKTGLEVRKNNELYLKYVSQWFNKIMPMIAQRQIHKGGNVILVQLENEMPGNGWRNWGIQSDGKHMDKLLELAHQNKIEVPMIFSGIHHAHNPAPDKPIDVTKRKSPWISMELWTIWFDRYNNSGADLIKGERSAWRVLAQGGAGFNLYMFHGGTTFGYNNFSNDTKFGDNGEKGTACYDFGTLVGQAGDTRDLYARLKRLAYQTETYSPILAQSKIDSTLYTDFAKGISVTVRNSPIGSLVFLNNKNNDTTVVLSNGISMNLAAKEIAALAMDMKLSAGVSIRESSSRILGIVKQKNVITIVCFGPTGDKSRIVFSQPIVTDKLTAQNVDFRIEGNTVNFQYPLEEVDEQLFNVGGEKIRLLVMNNETADKTWFIDTKTGRQIVVGAPYLGEFSMKSPDKIYAEIDYPVTENAPKQLTVYSATQSQLYKLPAAMSPENAIALNPWQMALYNISSAKNSNDTAWFSMPDGTAPELGMNNNQSPYAWYRTHFKNDSTIVSLLFRKIGDRASFFLDGKMVADYDYKKDKIAHIPVNIPAGMHDLTVFVAHSGRRKFSGYTGSLNTLESQKGLRGPIFGETPSGFTPITKWEMKGGVNPQDTAIYKWSNVASTKNVPACFKTSFVLTEQPAIGSVYRFTTDGLSFGNVWLNGHNLGRYPELVKDCPGIWLPSCWMKKGVNELAVFDEKGNSPLKTKVITELAVSRKRIVLNVR